MALRESIVIAASPEAIWPFVADPDRMAEWNPKIISVERTRSGLAMLAEQFTAIYRMTARETKCKTEVVSLAPYDHVVYEHRMEIKNIESAVQERYEMREVSESVQVTQTIDLSRSGIPWYFRFLIEFIHRVGRPMEESALSRMKRLAEQPNAG